MASCPSCNKFAALEMQDPEMENLEINGTIVSCSVRIVRSSECCGDEIKEATLEMEEEIDPSTFEGHLDDKHEPLEGHELEVEEKSVDQLEEGGGRYKKSYFGAEVTYSVSCACQKAGEPPLHEGTLSDKVAASHMDELT